MTVVLAIVWPYFIRTNKKMPINKSMKYSKVFDTLAGSLLVMAVMAICSLFRRAILIATKLMQSISDVANSSVHSKGLIIIYRKKTPNNTAAIMIANVSAQKALEMISITYPILSGISTVLIDLNPLSYLTS